MSMSAAEYGLTISEDDFTETLLHEAQLGGWRVFHIPDWIWRSIFSLWKRHGFRKGRTWPSKGFPDLILLRPPEIMVAEVKTMQGTVSTEQRGWLIAFAECGLENYVWRPAHLDWIRWRLSREGERGETAWRDYCARTGVDALAPWAKPPRGRRP
jgi:hypothetical protein